MKVKIQVPIFPKGNPDIVMTAEEIIAELKKLADPKNIEGMERYNIHTKHALGLNAPDIRKVGKKIKTDHRLALQLWKTKYLEARVLASIIDDPKLVTEKQMERWVHDFDNWAVCDGVCSNLFNRTSFAVPKAIEWCGSEKEFVKRAGFVMMAELAMHDKKAGDAIFISFFPYMQKEAKDERAMVKKGVNWALRQIGKRNKRLHAHAIKAALRIQKQNSSSAKWIANDALRELRSEGVLRRLKN